MCGVTDRAFKGTNRLSFRLTQSDFLCIAVRCWNTDNPKAAPAEPEELYCGISAHFAKDRTLDLSPMLPFYFLLALSRCSFGYSCCHIRRSGPSGIHSGSHPRTRRRSDLRWRIHQGFRSIRFSFALLLLWWSASQGFWQQFRG